MHAVVGEWPFAWLEGMVGLLRKGANPNAKDAVRQRFSRCFRLLLFGGRWMRLLVTCRNC